MYTVKQWNIFFRPKRAAKMAIIKFLRAKRKLASTFSLTWKYNRKNVLTFLHFLVVGVKKKKKLRNPIRNLDPTSYMQVSSCYSFTIRFRQPLKIFFRFLLALKMQREWQTLNLIMTDTTVHILYSVTAIEVLPSLRIFLDFSL